MPTSSAGAGEGRCRPMPEGASMIGAQRATGGCRSAPAAGCQKTVAGGDGVRRLADVTGDHEAHVVAAVAGAVVVITLIWPSPPLLPGPTRTGIGCCASRTQVAGEGGGTSCYISS